MWNVPVKCFGDIVAGQVARDNFSITYPAAKVVSRQVARKVRLNSTYGNVSCNLSSSNFARCKVCYAVKFLCNLYRQNIARQFVRNISQSKTLVKRTRK